MVKFIHRKLSDCKLAVELEMHVIIDVYFVNFWKVIFKGNGWLFFFVFQDHAVHLSQSLFFTNYALRRH